jgi:hypothetical protein
MTEKVNSKSTTRCMPSRKTVKLSTLDQRVDSVEIIRITIGEVL